MAIDSAWLCQFETHPDPRLQDADPRARRRSGTPSSSRTITSVPKCRTSPTSSAIHSACRAKRRRPTPRSSCSAACTSWRRRPPFCRRTRACCCPTSAAGCSLAATIDADQLREWKAEHPGAVVVSYVNTTAEVKAESDYCCTSGNAVEVVNSIPAGRGDSLPPRHVPRCARAARDGSREHPCVDGRMSRARRHRSRAHRSHQRAAHPGAEFLIHPECGCATNVVEAVSAGEIDPTGVHILSTEGMIRRPAESTATTFIVATEIGILHRLRKANPRRRSSRPTTARNAPT